MPSLELANNGGAALAAIQHSDPASWLSAPPDLSKHARTACQYFFALSSPYSSTCPIPHLFTDGFDAEQIWQQIDLQARPLLSSVRRRIARFQRSDNNEPLFEVTQENHGATRKRDKVIKTYDVEHDKPEFEEELLATDDNEEEEEEDNILQHPSEDASGGNALLEDRFLKLDEMERFLDQAEAQDTIEGRFAEESFGDSEMDNTAESEEEVNDSQMVSRLSFSANAGKGGHGHNENMKYKDFFDNDGKQHKRRSYDTSGKPEETDSKLEKVSKIIEAGTELKQTEKMESMSTHERQLEKVRKRVEQLEMANLDAKSWTLQGEVSAAKRPKNSALEVDLDFEHNARPAPVITEEVTASLEDMIRSRIAEERFDDVQRSFSAPIITPKKQIEVDETKSKKGLGELYEEEYMQTMGLAPVAASASDGLKKEANVLFKTLCTKLDALSHFHFTPKPPVEEMAVQSNLPALAMEEVAPLAVSDANMLAPEEIFVGEGIKKTDKEMTHSERRRRAKKNRMQKADKAKGTERKSFQNNEIADGERYVAVSGKRHQNQHSQRWKPAKVFADLDKAKDAKNERANLKSDAPLPSFLKL